MSKPNGAGRVQRVTKKLEEVDLLGDLKALCRERHVLLASVLGDERLPHVVRIRDIFITTLAEQYGMTNTAIGRLLERDTSTIRSAYLRQAVRNKEK